MKRIYRQLSTGTVCSCRYHVVWCTVFQRPVLTEPMQIRLKGVIEEGCQELNVELLSLRVHLDRIAIQVETFPEQDIHRVVYGLRRRCAAMLRREFPELRSRLPSIFTASYFVTTEERFPEEEVAVWCQRLPKSQKTKQKKEWTYAARTRLE